MTSRKWPDSEASAAQRFSVSAWVARPIRAAKNGSSGRVSSTMRPLSQSTQNRVARASTGTTAPATSAGRKRAAYGSTDAAPWAARVTARSGAGRRSAGAASQRSTSRLAQGHGDLDPDPGGDPLGGPGQPGPHREQAREPEGRRAQRRALDDGDHEGGERGGQADGRDPLEDADDRQDGDRPAGRRCRPEQPWVEGPHRGMRRRVTSARRGPGRGMCCVPSRLRNTQ